MPFPSIESALRGAAATFRRFPAAILSGLVACLAAIAMIEGAGDDWEARLLATAVMGLPLFTAVTTTGDRLRLPAARRWLVSAVLAALLAVLYLASLRWADRLASLRFIQLILLAHLAVAVAPYVATDRPNGFWQYNRFLLLRFLTAVFFSLVLFLGLSVALAALDKLFGIDVPGESYGYLMAVLAFVFHPWFFLAGVPEDVEALDAREDYPLVLKVFSQFVLIPLVTVYLAILTAYLGKVLITRTWPSGWIGYLVSSVSTAGVLALLLVHPIRRREDSRWVNVYARWWFIALLPSLVMLLLAVSKRIGQYGITEERYFLLALTFWMLGISLYYGVTGSTNIKRIPETLLLVVILTAAGPWSAYAVSVRSQAARLQRILAEHGMGRLGDISPPRAAVPAEDRAQIGAVIRYLGDTHGPGTLARVLGVPEDTAAAWSGRSDLDDAVVRLAMRRLGVEYVDRYARLGKDSSYWAQVSAQGSVDIRGFEVIRNVMYPNLGWIGTATDSLELMADTANSTIIVKHAGAPIVTLDLPGAVRIALSADSIALRRNLMLSEPIIIEGSGDGYRVRMVLETVHGQLSGGTLRVQVGNGFLLAAGFKERR